MLTPRADDPNRKNELERKKNNPESFGRTEIPPIGERIIINNTQPSGELNRLNEEKTALKKARLDVIAVKEDLSIATSNLINAKPKDTDAMNLVVLELTNELSDFEDVLNALLDM